MKIFNKILIALLCAFPLMWQGCADDSFEPERNVESFQGISVKIPYVAPGSTVSSATKAALTRAGQDVAFDPEEAAINNLYVFAFARGSKGKSDAVELTNLSSATDKINSKTVNMKLEIGEYHVYVLANVNLSDKYKTMSEEDVRDLQIDGKIGTLDEFTEGLPMSCSPMHIGSSENSYYIAVEAGNTTSVEAKMKFAVSKVRVSVVNDVDDFTVTDLKVKNIAQLLNYCVDSQKGNSAVSTTDKSVKDGAAYYSLTEKSNGKYDVDNLENGTESPQNTRSWIWQVDFYVPENLDVDNPTKMELTVPGKSATFNLGEKIDGGKQKLTRSQYYRYYVVPNTGQVTLEVITWTPDNIITLLGGPITLEVDKTKFDEPISGTEPGVLTVTSNVSPDFKSPEMVVNDKSLPVFLAEIKTVSNGVYQYTVKVNGDLGIQSSEVMKSYNYFYVTAGPIKKKIEAVPNLEAYLKVTPESYNVVMKEIANEVEYEVIYTYSTNLPNLRYEYGSGNNNQTKTGELSYYLSTATLPISESEMAPGSVLRNGNKGEGDGRIIVRFNAPYDPNNFQEESNIVYHYVATGTNVSNETVTKTADVKLNIIPNRNGYRLWFRDVNDEWNNVHIYVYQPLTYADSDGNYGLVKCHEENNNGNILLEDALMYSITGKKTFKGWWKKDGETRKNFAPTWVATWKPKAFNCTDLWIQGSNDKDDYYYQTDFLKSWREGLNCDKCKPDASDYARVWPGIEMKKITTKNHAQENWWYIDLPAICEPGKTLIMFSNGHGDAGQFEHTKRYPLHYVPGIPLYDFPDREGWFAYDYTKGNQGNGNEFVDDQPVVIPHYTYSIHGQIFGNPSWSSFDMIEENGKWTLETNMVSGGFGIKACINGDQKKWISGKNGTLNTAGSNECVTEGGTNFNLESAGTYKFVFDPEKMTLTISGGTSYNNNELYDLWYAINNDNNNWTASPTMVKIDNNVYTVKLFVKDWFNFGIRKVDKVGGSQTAWYNSENENGTISNFGTDYSVGSKTNWYIGESGLYTFTFNPTNKTLKVTN